MNNQFLTMLFTVDTNALTVHTADTKAFEPGHTTHLQGWQGYVRVHLRDFTGGPAVRIRLPMPGTPV